MGVQYGFVDYHQGEMLIYWSLCDSIICDYMPAPRDDIVSFFAVIILRLFF